MPTLAERAPSLKLQAAVSQMQSQLTVLSSMFNLVRPFRLLGEHLVLTWSGLQHANAIKPSTLREADRLVWLAGANAAFLDKSMEAACAA